MDKPIDIRTAWRAAIIEGEGWFRLHIATLRTGTPCVRAEIAVANTDAVLMTEVKAILLLLGIRFSSYIRLPRTGGAIGSRRVQIVVEVRRRIDCLSLAYALHPYLIAKQGQAAALIQAIEHRSYHRNYRSPAYVKPADDQLLSNLIERMKTLNHKELSHE